MSDTSDPSAWTAAATGETPTDIFNDQTNFVGIILCSFGYGIVFTLYCTCSQILYAQLWQPEKRRQAAFMLTYVSVMTLCGGLYFASTSHTMQLAYVDFRNYPAGPNAYTNVTYSSPINVLGVVLFFIVSWMSDAMIIWRVYVLYSSKPYPWLVIAFPCLLYLASFSTSIVIIFETSRPNQSFWSSAAIPFGLAFYTLTSTLTIVATILMTIRLLLARKQYIEILGNTSHAKQYLSIAAMLIESYALSAIWSIIFLILYAVNHPMQNVFLATLLDISIIALLLIIVRVSRGTAWNANTDHVLATKTVGSRTRSTATQASNKDAKPPFQAGDDPSVTRFEDSVAIDTFTVDDSKKVNV